MLSGPTPVRLKAPLSRASAEVEIDLTRAAIDSPQTGSLKTAGKPGKANFTLKPEADGGATVSAIVVDAGGLSARGSAQFAADGGLVSAKLTPIAAVGVRRVALDLQDAAGGLKATVRGVSLDARALIKGFSGSGGPPGGGKDIDVDVKIANVIGANSQSIRDFEMSGSVARRDAVDEGAGARRPGFAYRRSRMSSAVCARTSPTPARSRASSISTRAWRAARST